MKTDGQLILQLFSTVSNVKLEFNYSTIISTTELFHYLTIQLFKNNYPPSEGFVFTLTPTVDSFFPKGFPSPSGLAMGLPLPLEVFCPHPQLRLWSFAPPSQWVLLSPSRIVEFKFHV